MHLVYTNIIKDDKLPNKVWFYYHFIFFVTYDWAQKARVFVTGKPFWPTVVQLSSLLGQYISYEENEVLWMWYLFTKLMS